MRTARAETAAGGPVSAPAARKNRMAALAGRPSVEQVDGAQPRHGYAEGSVNVGSEGSATS